MNHIEADILKYGLGNGHMRRRKKKVLPWEQPLSTKREWACERDLKKSKDDWEEQANVGGRLQEKGWWK